jgi:hypothetical protein
MDRRALVDEKTPSANTDVVEQAIFTSIRSPLGQGYRIVAASSGISGDEKKEIIQCAPSHGSLCDPSPTAVGLASFELRSGRHCIFLSRNAGLEPTARGGYRIHTHVLVMEPAVFRAFQCDPLNVEAAARAAISLDAPPTPPTRLDPFPLAGATGRPVSRQPSTTPPPRAADADRVVHMLSAVLGGRRLLVVGVPAPQRALRWLLGATPTAARQHLSVSHGLKFSPSRGFQLVFAEADDRETQSIARDHDVALLHWEASPAAASSPFDAWLRCVRRHWESDRHNQLNRLSAQLTQEDSAQALGQVATLCADIERAKEADASLLDELMRRYAEITPASPGQERLLRELQEAVRMRREMLRPAEEEGSSDGEPEIIGLA